MIPRMVVKGKSLDTRQLSSSPGAPAGQLEWVTEDSRVGGFQGQDAWAG